MTHFKLVGTHDNGNLIDGTPGCPTVQVMGNTYRCSRTVAAVLDSISKRGYIQAQTIKYPLEAKFVKHTGDSDWDILEFARNTKGIWYVQTVSF